MKPFLIQNIKIISEPDAEIHCQPSGLASSRSPIKEMGERSYEQVGWGQDQERDCGLTSREASWDQPRPSICG